MLEEFSIAYLAQKIGAAEPGLRLMISLLLCYPISFIHRKYLFGKKIELQHYYFIFSGIALCYFNFGLDVIHSLISVAICYCTLKQLGGGILSLSIVFIYTMAHLLIGYWCTSTGDYDIKWTMPQCVLTLRLIGLAFNLSDGIIPEEKLSAENKKVALREMPSVLEVFAHSYFPGSFLIGPQFSLQRYQDFVQLTLYKKENQFQIPKSISAGLKNLGLGLFYCSVYQIGSMYVTDDFMTSEYYLNLSVWKQYLYLGIWARLALYKYISCWLVAEGSLTVIGITYNGVDEQGNTKWDGCSNVKVSVFESATRMNHYIDSFNVNTNHWVAQYIYKRLKFLNNRVYSQIGVLLFLAVWHGFHSGYYMTFFFEFISILGEKTLIKLLEDNVVILEFLSRPYFTPIVYVFLRIYTFLCMGYAMIPFILLKYNKYMPLFVNFRFSLHIFYISIIFFAPKIKKYLIRPLRKPVSTEMYDQSSSSKSD